jgi:hypothetical protein
MLSSETDYQMFMRNRISVFQKKQGASLSKEAGYQSIKRSRIPAYQKRQRTSLT